MSTSGWSINDNSTSLTTLTSTVGANVRSGEVPAVSTLDLSDNHHLKILVIRTSELDGNASTSGQHTNIGWVQDLSTSDRSGSHHSTSLVTHNEGGYSRSIINDKSSMPDIGDIPIKIHSHLQITCGTMARQNLKS